MAVDVNGNKFMSCLFYKNFFLPIYVDKKCNALYRTITAFMLCFWCYILIVVIPDVSVVDILSLLLRCNFFPPSASSVL